MEGVHAPIGDEDGAFDVNGCISAPRLQAFQASLVSLNSGIASDCLVKPCTKKNRNGLLHLFNNFLHAAGFCEQGGGYFEINANDEVVPRRCKVTGRDIAVLHPHHGVWRQGAAEGRP
jgi:hypothetical protein